MKCIYRDSSDNKCGRSTSSHHCNKVNDDTCDNCDLHQTTLTVSPKTRLQNIIKESIKLLENNDITEAKRILKEAMKI